MKNRVLLALAMVTLVGSVEASHRGGREGRASSPLALASSSKHVGGSADDVDVPTAVLEKLRANAPLDGDTSMDKAGASAEGMWASYGAPVVAFAQRHALTAAGTVVGATAVGALATGGRPSDLRGALSREFVMPALTAVTGFGLAAREWSRPASDESMAKQLADAKERLEVAGGVVALVDSLDGEDGHSVLEALWVAQPSKRGAALAAIGAEDLGEK